MRKIRIVALQSPKDKVGYPVTVEKNVEWTVSQIRKLSEYHVDIVCLPEMFSAMMVTSTPTDYAEPVPGPTTKTMMKLAKECNTAIICPIYEKRNRKYYNTAVVINRSGNIVGQYDKIHPVPDNEIKGGVVPGKRTPTVIDLDGIKIGCQICFDAHWPEDWVNLKKAGAQIIFFSSMFSAGKLLESYATILYVPIVAATCPGHCRIYDRTGRMIANQTPYYDYALADVLINQPLFHLNGNFVNVEKIQKEHREVATEVFNGEATFTISGSNDPKTLQRIIDEYKIVDVDDYLMKVTKAQDKARQ